LAKIKDAIERKHYWDGALYAVAVMWEAHGSLWYGYEVEGFDNIPNEGPALIVYYHGAIPLDYYYLSAKCLLYKKRLIRAVGDHFLFRIPGIYHFIFYLILFLIIL
jgi:1-acyl-sn-glycerol-3-phosphate acyltransferase